MRYITLSFEQNEAARRAALERMVPGSQRDPLAILLRLEEQAEAAYPFEAMRNESLAAFIKRYLSSRFATYA